MAPKDPFGLLGQVLDGQFRVDSYVGEGGFSVVYRGTHVGLSEPIAIKCLKLPAALGSALVESFVRRFRDESRLHYKLSQGNLHVVRSMASGTVIAPATSALVPYTVLEWLEGRSLADEFVDRRTRGLRGRPLAEVVRLLDSAVDAVAHAHAQGVVHRDLNPGNLFLAQTVSGVRLKVLDFGVAKVMADSAIAMGPTARTVGNVRMFAPAYGAPEQFDERAGAIGPWTDVYALALVVLEALTDRTVMEGHHIGEFAMRALDAVNRPTPRSLGVPVGDDVEVVMARAVALSPQERPRDAGELWGMLKHSMTADGQSGRRPHAYQARSEPPPPNTLRINTPVPEETSPAVEIVRPPTHAPPAISRAHGGTLRMSHSPRSATEALAATPSPAATATVRLITPPPPSPMSPLSPAPLSPALPGGSVASESLPVASPYAVTALAAAALPPVISAAPPLIIVPSSASAANGSITRAAVEEPRRRSSRALTVVLVLLVVGALAAGAWWFKSRGRSHAAPASPVPAAPAVPAGSASEG